MAKPVVRLTVNLTPEVAEALKDLASRLETTQTDALHQAILTSAMLQKQLSEGARVVVKHRDTTEEVRLKAVNSLG